MVSYQERVSTCWTTMVSADISQLNFKISSSLVFMALCSIVSGNIELSLPQMYYRAILLRTCYIFSRTLCKGALCACAKGQIDGAKKLRVNLHPAHQNLCPGTRLILFTLDKSTPVHKPCSFWPTSAQRGHLFQLSQKFHVQINCSPFLIPALPQNTAHVAAPRRHLPSRSLVLFLLHER